MADLSWHRRGAPERRSAGPRRPALASQAAAHARDLEDVFRLLSKHLGNLVNELIDPARGDLSDRLFPESDTSSLVDLDFNFLRAADALHQLQAGTATMAAVNAAIVPALRDLGGFTADLRRAAEELAASANTKTSRERNQA